jgi:predicted transcriptional regulator
MSKKIDRLQVIHDILKTISEKNGKIKPTHILYKSNLSHQMMEEYLEELIQKDFIIKNENKKGKTYSITLKGSEYLNRYKFVVDFVESFGLS